MSKKVWLTLGSIVLVIAVWALFFRGGEAEPEIEYRYSAVEKGELIRSTSATGLLVALTTVDVKSKAGGKVERLLVEEGTVVKAGDRIAIIDPSDTESTYQQAEADLTTAQARAEQAKINYALTAASNVTSVADAEAALASAKIRLARVEVEVQRQPALTKSSLANAEAAYASAQENLKRTQDVTIPSMRREAEGALRSSETAVNVAKDDLERQSELLAKGYVAQSTVDRARQAYESARTAYNNATQRVQTLEVELRSTLRSAQLQLEQSKAALDLAKTNSTQDVIARRNLDEAKNAVRQAEIALQKAKDNRRNDDVRQSDIRAAKAGTVRSQVALKNAKVQLDSTTVVAPRDGVVTLKYLEEGTIIPPGTSTFAQGTSLIQLSDVSKMFVECGVDEADIGAVREGQDVRIVTEAFPGVTLDGKVVRVNPAAKTEQNITAIKVRVEIKSGSKVQLRPGMTATCEFITLSKPDVMIVPAQAVQNENGKAFVKVKGPNPSKPVVREVKLGETGNNGIEIVSGLAVGDEVVTAEIDLVAMRETQQKMQDAAQGGGLAGSPMGGRPRSSSTRSTTTGGGTGGRGTTGR